MDDKVGQKITEKLVDSGKLIEGGFMSLLALSYPGGCSDAQREDLRSFFFAGAQHLFSSVMVVLSVDKEPTEEDMHRMTMIFDELEEFKRQFLVKHNLSN